MNKETTRNRNWPAKIISIIFAIILWFIAIGEENPEIPKSFADIPVRVRNEVSLDSRDLSLLFDIEEPMTVRLRGRARDIHRIESDNLRGFIDLSKVDKAGEQKVQVDIEGIPLGVRLEKQPERTIVIDRKTSKKIPVEVDIKGREAASYQMQPYTLKPDKVIIVGPESLVDKAVRGRVSLDLKQSKSTVEQSLSIKLLDENDKHIESKFLSLDQDFSIVTVPIFPEKDLAIEAAITGKPADGYEIDDIEVQPKRITVSGNEKLLNDMESISTELIDINNIKDDIKRTVKLQKYEDIYLNPVQPSEVNVIVRVKKIQVERELSKKVDIENLNREREAQLSTKDVSIVIRGHKPIIDKLDEDMVKIYADLEGVSRGERKLKLKASVPAGVEVLSIEPKEITIRVK